jgi:Domain of unknown function (DUF5069)
MTASTSPLLRPMDATLDGYAWLPRMIDKSRANARGSLGSTVHPCPVDKRCLRRLGVSFSTFTEIVAASATDGEVLVRLRRHGVASPREQWFDAVAYEEELQRAA